MALRDPREVERAVDDIRAAMKATMSDDTMPEQDRRDALMRMTGEVQALEVQARELREHELEQVKAAAQVGTPVGAQSVRDEKVSAFSNFVRSGEISAAMTTTPDSAGGFLVPDPLVENVIDVVRKVNPIAQLATVFTMSVPGTNKIDLPRKAAATAGGWVGETAARPATNSATLAQQTLTAFEWYANPEATQLFLDTVADAEQFIIDDITATFNANFGTALAAGTGNGNSQPTGLFTGTSYYTTKLSGTADALDAPQLLNAYFSLPAQYLPNAVWLANGATFATLSALAWPNMNNTPLVSWVNGEPYIMGKRCIISDDAPAIGNGNFPLAFGDIARGYAVGIHRNISVLRDPYTNKPYVSFYAAGRAGGVPWDPNAVLLLKSDNA